ncbi:hypothetical protein ABN763_02740 [Spongiivirga sp. MCCC 1A20706]|uniref:hypothetical protein n=1 Tax=Spongiivirga sp. MCCC 1A20706 TaxID=3160963 RepID=UPI0039774539
MDKKRKNSAKLGIAIGVLGLITGILLSFSGNAFIGVAGSIASVGVAFKGITDLKK